jgi:hypothetical protein
VSLRRIDSVEELRGYLQAALQLEHSTIPPYLAALYSLHPDSNHDAAQILKAVVLEEMLHLTLVANLLNAVGGTPDFSGADFVPTYPTHLPDGESDFEVSVRPFSPEAVATFLRIERPDTLSPNIDFVQRARSARALLPGLKDGAGAELHFYSIGDFYQEIHRGLRALHDELSARGEDLFVGDPARQIDETFRYGGGGEVIAVTDLPSAEAVIRLICTQGEGLGGGVYDEEDELSHYHRFEQIVLGRYYRPGDAPGRPGGAAVSVDWSRVYPILTDACLDDYVDHPRLHEQALTFASAYQGFLALLTRAFTGQPDQLDVAVGEMFHLKTLAVDLMRQPIEDGPAHAAPVFRL